MKQIFRTAKLGAVNLKRLDKINEIIEQYKEMGYTLTLRQLYYRLVTTNTIANNTKEYARLIHLLTEGRMSGIVDWDGIEDRVRKPYMPYTNDSVNQAIAEAERHYRLDRQEGQKYHVELWVEKDAISNILKVRTHYYGIYLMVNRGFSSTTAMYESYQRMSQAIEDGKTPKILYLGDHDPSGLCMALTDIPNRLNQDFGVPVEVKHIGITMDQIKKYNPPTNPAKITDSRSKWYIKNYGNSSWEVDALEPEILHELINKEIEEYVDIKLFKDVLTKEAQGKKELLLLPDQRDRLINLAKHIESFDNNNVESSSNKPESFYSSKKSVFRRAEKDKDRELFINEIKSILNAST